MIGNLNFFIHRDTYLRISYTYRECYKLCKFLSLKQNKMQVSHTVIFVVCLFLCRSVTTDLKCDVCYKPFTTKSNLTRHQKVDWGKLVICHQCDKTFTLQQHLKVHLSQHACLNLQLYNSCAESTWWDSGRCLHSEGTTRCCLAWCCDSWVWGTQDCWWWVAQPVAHCFRKGCWAVGEWRQLGG